MCAINVLEALNSSIIFIVCVMRYIFKCFCLTIIGDENKQRNIITAKKMEEASLYLGSGAFKWIYMYNIIVMTRKDC